jgi:hypothetical protein
MLMGYFIYFRSSNNAATGQSPTPVAGFTMLTRPEKASVGYQLWFSAEIILKNFR